MGARACNPPLGELFLGRSESLAVDSLQGNPADQQLDSKGVSEAMRVTFPNPCILKHGL